MKLPNKLVLGDYNEQINEPYFITVTLSSSKPEGSYTIENADGAQDNNGQDNQDITEIIKTTYISSVFINFYGNNAMEMAIKLRAALATNPARASLRKQKIAIQQISEIKDFSEFVQSQAEERARIVLTINHTHIIHNQINQIKEAPVRTYIERIKQHEFKH